MTIREFIKSNKEFFNRYRSRGTWNGYQVFYVWNFRDEGCCVGLPQFALEKNGQFRMADTDEIFEILDRNPNQQLRNCEQIAVITKREERNKLNNIQ